MEINTYFKRGYYVTAELSVKKKSRIEAARQALGELARKSLQEPGCSIFVVQQDSATPTRFLLWERFDDEAAFKQHFNEAHTKSYLAQDLTEVCQYFITDVAA